MSGIKTGTLFERSAEFCKPLRLVAEPLFCTPFNNGIPFCTTSFKTKYALCYLELDDTYFRITQPVRKRLVFCSVCKQDACGRGKALFTKHNHVYAGSHRFN